jgi:GNAT superfamily N-acetyltransferase
MPAPETLRRFIALVEQNAHVQAIGDFYTADASMQENLAPPRVGRDRLVANEQRVLARTKSVSSQCVGPVFVNGDRVVIRWRFRFESHEGVVRELEEMAYQQWRGERICQEQFFYDPAQFAPRPAAPAFSCRRGVPGDARVLGVLATQVFLDTYATKGVDADLAAEATKLYAPAAFEARLRDPQVEITVVEVDGHAAGFLDLALHGDCPVPGVVGPQVLRLYVQAPFQRRGLGRALLQRAEARARELQAPSVWLTAWVGNAAALLFYPRVGYKSVGETPYLIEGKAYRNQVFAKALATDGA